MGYATCKKCNGSGRFYDYKSSKTFDCKACDGTGSNKNLWTTRCERCGTEIVYKANTPTPRFCRECKNVQLEKNCAQYGCNHTIRYKVGWDNVPTYCKSCEQKRNQGWSAKTCSGIGVFFCGKLVWSPPGKNFNLCRECSEKERAIKEAKWKTKSCKSCQREIRYHADWSNIPDYCPDCIAWKKKTCSNSNCTNTVQYKSYWDNIPNLCEDCRKKHKTANEGKHGYAYKKARKEFMIMSLNDPTVPSRIKEWITQEIKTKGHDGYWESPPGYDVGHIISGLDDPNNFRWETRDMNRSRGAKYHK